MHNCSQKLCIVTFDETIAEFTPSFQWGSCYSIFCFMCMFCRSLFVLLSFFLLVIVLSVFRFTDSDYPFGIFELFLLTFDFD